MWWRECSDARCVAGGIPSPPAWRTSGRAKPPIPKRTRRSRRRPAIPSRRCAWRHSWISRTAGGFAVLVGAWTRHAAGVLALADTHLLLVNPDPGVAIRPGTSGLRADEGVPIAPGSARALAVDASMGPEALAAAVAGVQAGGRVVAPATFSLPDGVTELARDASVWVGERDAAASGLVSLSRGGR